ncbi:hypothetical protein GYMLUDRAFT_46373 [Collybiopsis luxurians FD-317 M1]|uniref:Zn(2)-C6 fungal-type domain-containing protein n=1 Tax=Collybiopsis luxurians FD-317 M1 TaxID=944289 RepID=A0A0D0B1U7_9AGAR|nr:hypothetical protein GYMLUDRAFT_46373 [Collybiopsis luxurians FD-317 M1]
MTPSGVASSDGQNMDRYEDGRPAKRARTDSITAEDMRHNPPSGSPSLDQHVFISETSLATKKQTGKKPPLSCCECRRLKLRCDRTFPCGSCKKRGVSDICPDGVLVSGKGTRFILANTEQLHSKIQDMSEHIRRLEEALEKSSNNSNPHPLLQPEMLSVKSTMELYGVTQPKHNGTAIPVSSERNFDRDSPFGDSERKWDSQMSSVAAGKQREDTMEAQIQSLSVSFPQGDGRLSSGPNVQLREYIRSQLPPRQESAYLWEQLQAHAAWQCNLHPDDSFFPNLTHHCYSTALEELSPRRLALLFMLLALGSLVDLKRPAKSLDSEKYHTLARAALCEISLLEDATLETITALYYDLLYLLMFSDKKKSLTQAWAIMGLTTKLAQSIGLHRNGVKSKVIPEEVENRRNLFWELSYLDARLALSLGRPPSLSIKYSDCSRPAYIPDSDCDYTESSHHYQSWKHSFYVECLYPVVDALSQPGIEYSSILELDTLVRNFPVPEPLRNPNPRSRTLLLQQVSFTIAYESVLLQLHRTYFMRALSGPEEAFNKRHRYAPSVVAVWLGAVRMIAAVQTLYQREPELASRIMGYWSNAFSGVVAIALLVSRAPFTCLSPAGLQELERARLMFKEQTSPRADQVVPMLDTIIAKANNIFQRWYHGQEVPTVVLRHEEEHDPLFDELMKMDSNTFVPAPSPPPTDDSFKNAHPILTQCIAEAHERAKIMFPMRKPCQCSIVSTTCPPSHSWAPVPAMDISRPVLPFVYPDIANPLRFNDSPTIPSHTTPYYTGANSVNFELGALQPNTEQGWLGWF